MFMNFQCVRGFLRICVESVSFMSQPSPNQNRLLCPEVRGSEVKEVEAGSQSKGVPYEPVGAPAQGAGRDGGHPSSQHVIHLESYSVCLRQGKLDIDLGTGGVGVRGLQKERRI